MTGSWTFWKLLIVLEGDGTEIPDETFNDIIDGRTGSIERMECHLSHDTEAYIRNESDGRKRFIQEAAKRPRRQTQMDSLVTDPFGCKS